MKNIRTPLLIIAAAGMALRIAFGLYSGFLETEYYNEYGDIAQNIVSGKGYSFFYFEGDSLAHIHKTEARPYPSAYMPPGYVYYLVPAMEIEDPYIRNAVLLTMHSFFGGAVVFLMGLLTFRLFRNKTTALTASVITALLPEFIYASLTFTPTIIYHAVVLGLFFIIQKYRENKSETMLIYIGTLIVVGIFFRPELLLFTVFAAAYIFKFDKRHAFLLLIIAAAGMMPWQFRNMALFKEPVFLSTSSGLNFYRGHNPYEPGVWADEKIEREIRKYRGEDRFEYYYNSLYYDAAVKSISEYPMRQLNYAAENFYKFILFDFSGGKSSHPLYFIPWLLLLGAGVYGIKKTFSLSKFGIIYLFLLFSLLIVLLFFFLPRYQTMMKIAIVPFAAYTVSVLYDKLIPVKRKE